MIDKKHDPDESEAKEPLDAPNAIDEAAGSESAAPVTDTLIKKKSAEPALDEQDEQNDGIDELDDPDDEDGDYDDGVELTSDERLAALIYDDEDDSVQLKSDTASPAIDIFSIGSMIPKLDKMVILDEVAEPEPEVIAEAVESADTERETVVDTASAPDDEGEEIATDVEHEHVEEEPTQLEFELDEPESRKEQDAAVTEIEATEKKTPDTAENKKYDPEHPRFIDTVFSWLELLLFTLVTVMVLTSFVFKLSVVEGGSMDKTLYNGERLIIYSLFYEPERFDIIVCEDYSTRLKKPIVKRVIALPGEHLVITADGTVTIDGVEIDESDYVYINQSDYTYSPIDIVIPEGEVFVMGDHRNISDDSRSEGIGPIDIDSILGKVVLRIYPFDRFGAVD